VPPVPRRRHITEAGYRTLAVVARRVEPKTSLDDFPTPPWATRALFEHVLADRNGWDALSCLEPACGAGHMATPLRERFGTVEAFDAHDYGYAGVRDFLSAPPEAKSYDWIVTNPPFRLAEEFVLTALDVASSGVAMIVRTMFLEGQGRYERLFSVRPPTRVAQFTERVPMVRGRMSKASKTATGYAWLVWEQDRAAPLAFSWVPPCRRRLERDYDYDVPAPLTGLKVVLAEGGPA